MRDLLKAGGRSLLFICLLSACNLIAGTLTPTPVPNIPTIEFQYPANDSTVAQGVDVQIQLLAQDAIGDGISRVELLVDDQPHQEGVPLISRAVPVFTVEMNWLAESVGLHSLSAVAFRADGTSSVPTTIRILVVPEDTTPTP